MPNTNSNNSANSNTINLDHSASTATGESRQDLTDYGAPTEPAPQVTGLQRSVTGEQPVKVSYDIVDMKADDTATESRLAGSTPSFANIIAPTKGDVEHSIRTWLSRPYKFTTVNFSTSTTANTEMASISLYSDLLALPYYQEKLHGFFGMRATVHVRMQVNGNRFQAGRLMLAYNPAAYYSSTHNYVGSNLTSRSQLPRIDLDIATESEVTLTVPYISDKPFYGFGNTSSYAGHVAVVCYSPLVAPAGSITAEVTLFTHLTDVELFWPSFITPQSGLVRSSRVKGNQNSEQWGDHKPVSSTLRVIGSALDHLKSVPLITSYVAPLSWVSKMGANLAASMGYCKPMSHSRQPVAIQYLANIASGSGFDYSQPMSLLEDNSLQICSGLGGSNLDHMALKYPLSIPTYLATFTWSNSQDYGTILYSENVLPGTKDVAVGTSYATTPLSFFARYFSYYRGSINVTFKFVKTEFHTGRLRFWYSPSGVPTEAQSNFLYSSIIDIKYSTQVTFNVPYMNDNAYTAVRDFSNPAYFGLMVVNELKSPATVSTNVAVIVEISAGSDFEFAVPRPQETNFPYYAYGVATGTGTLPTLYHADQVTITGQAGDPEFVSLQGQYLDEPVGNAPVFPPTLEPSKLAIGERVASVKQMITRCSPLASFTSNVFPQTLIINLDAPGSAMLQGPFTVAAGTQSAFTVIRDCYAFYRGGLRVKTVAGGDIVSQFELSNSSVSSPVGVNRIIDYFGLTRTSGASPVGFGALVPKPLGQQAQEVFVPNYSRNPARRPITSFRDLSNSTAIADQRVLTITPTLPSSGFVVYMGAADDFQLGLWISSPLLYTPALTSLNPVSDTWTRLTI